MPGDSVGGFYASLKLNVDKSSFSGGEAELKKVAALKKKLLAQAVAGDKAADAISRKLERDRVREVNRQIDDVARKNRQRIKNDRAAMAAEERNDKLMAYFASAKSKATPRWQDQIRPLDQTPGLTKQRLKEEQAERLKEHKLKKLIMDNEIAGAKKGEDIMAKINKKKLEDQEAMSTSTKWMLGAALGATAAFVALAKAMSDTSWGPAKETSQTARGLMVAPLWLERWQAAMRYAGGNEASVGGTVTKLNELIANPQRGMLDAGLITQISGILGTKTGDSRLAYSAMSKLSSEARFNVFVQALQKMFNSGGTNRTNALSIAKEAGLDTHLLTVAGGYSAAYAVGANATLMSADQMAQSEMAANEVAKIGAELKGAWDLLSSNMATLLLPLLQGFNDFFTSNRQTIIDLINGIKSIKGFFGGNVAQPGAKPAAPYTDIYNKPFSPAAPAGGSYTPGQYGPQTVTFHVHGNMDRSTAQLATKLLRDEAIYRSMNGGKR